MNKNANQPTTQQQWLTTHCGRSKPMRAGGFTLIELMIVVAVIGVLASIALPSYNESVRRSRRVDTQAVMLELTQHMERFYTENNRYDRNRAGTAFSIPSHLREAPREGSAKYYDLTATFTVQAYTVTAAPKGAQSGDRCGSYTLSNTGARGAAQADCWRR